MCRLRVEDDGPGIPADFAPHIFQPFTRIDNTQPGSSGLGLAVVSAIAHAHQGKAVCVPTGAGGTRFEYGYYIDVDFEHQRREEVMQHIYRKYGRDRAALTAAVTTYRPRSALREAGKALGVDPAIVDRVAKQRHWFDSRADLLQRFAEAGLDPETPLNQQWAAFAARLLG